LAHCQCGLKEQLSHQFKTLDPLALLKKYPGYERGDPSAIADGNSQPPARTLDDLAAFLDGARDGVAED
jgi:hypothetical protein